LFWQIEPDSAIAALLLFPCTRPVAEPDAVTAVSRLARASCQEFLNFVSHSPPLFILGIAEGSIDIEIPRVARFLSQGKRHRDGWDAFSPMGARGCRDSAFQRSSQACI
jgi:hypothetical protein